MSSKADAKQDDGGMAKSESLASLLVGEGIDSREGSPVEDPNSTAQAKKEDIPAVQDVPSAEDIPAVKSSDSGKPPRRPSLMQPRPSPVKTRTSSAEHRRKQSLYSLDDVSAMSGLTDEGGEYAVDLPFRQNNVSWDKEVAPADPGIAVPMLGENIDTSIPAPPMSPPTITSTPPAKRNWTKIRASLALKEDNTAKAVNPFETEAETAILRALEKTRRKNAAKAGNILPHVSEDAAEAFKQDVTPEQNNLTTNRKSSGGDERSILSGTTATSKGHKRNKTLDTTLFDLATQMDHLQNDRKGNIRERALTGDSAGVRGRFFSEEVDLAAGYKGNSGDVLVQNAAALFRRPIAKKQASSVDVGEDSAPLPEDSIASSSEGRRWSSIISQRSAESHKKTDGVEGFVVETAESNESDVDIETGVAAGGDSPDSVGDRKKLRFQKAGKGARRFAQAANNEVKEDFDTFRRFLQPRQGTIKFYLVFVICCLIIPGVSVAAILYYGTEPPSGPGLGREGASTSWFILFLTRQVVTGTLAKATEVLIIDLLSLQFRFTTRLFGTMFTLLLVQSKGWPCVVFWWGIYNFAMNSGDNDFAAHWLFWQDAIDLFNSNNPSGTITYSHTNYVVNGIAVVLSFIVAVKRLWWGLYLGKRSYRHYGDELAKTIKDMVMVSQVATWAKEIERYGRHAFKKRGFKSTVTHDVLSSYRVADLELEEDNGDEMLEYVDLAEPTDVPGKVIDEDKVDMLTESLTRSQKMRINELLGRWEEPESVSEEEESISIASILQFRQMLAYMDEDYPFSLAFGPADTRDACIASAQAVYSRLMLLHPDEIVLPFDTLAVLGRDKDGCIDPEKMKDFIRLFRPERNGDLTCLDFVRSCDGVYKEMRLLRASIANSGQIDHAFEILVNVVFYSIVGIIILVVLDLDPLALFVSISGIILAFAFMIGSASAKYFEGILFILVRRPYDIGDRIAVSSPEQSCSMDGSATWFVQTVGLFTTTVRFAATNEVATLANGSLSASRVINAKRSPQANVYVYMKFSVHVPYSRVLIFRKAVETFIKERPREWLALNGFRATRVEPDLGYIEYIIALGHRNSWQDIAAILQSKADVASYCLELAKKLDMRYVAPPLPVNLSMADPTNMQLIQKSSDAGSGSVSSPAPMSPDVRSLSALFKKEG